MSLDASKIFQIKLKTEAMWKDAQVMQEYVPNAVAAVAVAKNQSARLEALTDKDRENSIKVTWIDPCGTVVEDVDGSCEIGGDEPSTAAQVYELDTLKKASFTINHELLRTNDYSAIELIASQMLLKVKALDEWWAQQILIKLKAFAGVNGYPNGFTFSGGTTNIPADEYNAKLYTYLVQVGIFNKIPNSYLIDSGSLFAPLLDSELDAGNAEGKGLGLRAAYLSGKINFDQWNFLEAGITEDTFLVNPAAVAFKTKARYTANPVYVDGKIAEWRWTVKSRVIPGVEYDVISQMDCKPNLVTKQKEDVQNFDIITRGGVFLNPTGCPITRNGVTYSPTGVLSFTETEEV